MTENAFTGDSAKTDRKKSLSACDAKTVLRALGEHDRARRLTLDRYKALGGTLDAFNGALMAEALTYAEDQIEFSENGQRRTGADRDALRAVRRRLEVEWVK